MRYLLRKVKSLVRGQRGLGCRGLGLFSVAAAALAHEDGSVFAFEPDSRSDSVAAPHCIPSVIGSCIYNGHSSGHCQEQGLRRF
jgi:hypothetical protein